MKLQKILNKDLLEKQEAISLSLLCLIAGKSIFFYGPPGTAKSLVARRISCAFKNHTFFDYLMNRFSTPEEIFGPLSLENLRKDKLVRKTEGFLPSANFAFLDEIWKSSPAILNSLLTIINEKKFRNILASDAELNPQNLSQNELDKVPLKGLIAASNELPAKGQSLEALYDRFIMRLVVARLDTKASFKKLLQMPHARDFIEIESTLCFSDDELDSIKLKAQKCVISEVALNALMLLKENLQLHNKEAKKNNAEIIDISERRWINIMELLRYSAVLSDRDSVELIDLALLRHCLWDNLEQISVIENLIIESILPFAPSINYDDMAYERLTREVIECVSFSEDGEYIDMSGIPFKITLMQDSTKAISKSLQKVFLSECDGLVMSLNSSLGAIKDAKLEFRAQNFNVFLGVKDYEIFFVNLKNIESNILEIIANTHKLRKALEKIKVYE